jgi:hypothetical protein
LRMTSPVIMKTNIARTAPKTMSGVIKNRRAQQLKFKSVPSRDQGRLVPTFTSC